MQVMFILIISIERQQFSLFHLVCVCQYVHMGIQESH